MARPQLEAGTMGKVNVTLLAGGLYRARANARDDGGYLHQLSVTAGTEADARTALRKRAAAVSSGGVPDLLPSDTLADAIAAWLPQIRTRAKSGSLAYSTYESYEVIARLLLVPRFGAVKLGQLTAGRCDRILQQLLADESISKARRARSVLSMVCSYAVRDGAMPSNPVRDVQRMPTSPKKESALTPKQIDGIRELMERWDRPHGPRPNYRALIDGMDIMLGTSMRVGECIGLRRRDVDMTTSPPTVIVSGTIVSNRTEGTYRKDSPKRSRQRRTIALPSMAAAAVRRRLALAEPLGDALLFPTATGRSLSVSNYERLLRTFIGDECPALVALGVPVDEYTTHLYRRTAATLVERAAGITVASRLLGHANEQITRTSYVVSAEIVDPVTAQILDELLGP